MKKNIFYYLLSFSLACSLLTVSPISEAGRYHCRWVPAHWHHGHYVPAHKVCYKKRYRHRYCSHCHH